MTGLKVEDTILKLVGQKGLGIKTSTQVLFKGVSLINGPLPNVRPVRGVPEL